MAEKMTAGLGSSYDAVVVGAGNGGLSAALALAINGARPLLLEQHNIPGGFATSFVRGRFEFEASLHELSDVGPAENPGGVRKFFNEEAGLDIEWYRIPEAYRLIIPEDNINARIPFGIEEFIDAIEENAPGSREPVTNYLSFCKDISDVLGYIGELKGKPDVNKLLADFRTLLRESNRPFEEIADLIVKVTNLVKSLPRTADEITKPFNIPDRAMKIIAPYWCYMGLPMSRMAGTIWAGMLVSYLEKGAYLPRHRSNDFALAIDNRIRELGGHVEYNTRVERILVKNGKVTGVQTTRGDMIDTNCVICNASPTLAFNKLVHPHSEVPEIALRNVNSRVHGCSGFVVFMGLDASVEELGIEDYGYFISDHMDTDRLYEDMKKNALVGMQATTCLNNAVPDCSPPGTTMLCMTTLYKPEGWVDVKAKDYFRLKNEIAGQMIDQFENATGVHIRNHIEEIEVSTPATYARYTRSYMGGIYGYEPETWDYPITRVLALKDEQYIDGLTFAGGYSVMGHGYSPSIMSGRMAGMAALKLS